MNTLPALRHAMPGMLCLSLIVSTGAAQGVGDAGAKYTTFTVPGAASLFVESVNNSGTISGYYGERRVTPLLSYARATEP